MTPLTAFLAAIVAANLAYIAAARLDPPLAVQVYAGVLAAFSLASRRLEPGSLRDSLRAAAVWLGVHAAAMLLFGIAVNAVASRLHASTYWLLYTTLVSLAYAGLTRGLQPTLAWVLTTLAFYPLPTLYTLASKPLRMLRSIAWVAGVEAVANLARLEGIAGALFRIYAYSPYTWLPLTYLSDTTTLCYVIFSATLFTLYAMLPREEKPSLTTLAAVYATITLMALATGALRYQLLLVSSGSMTPTINPGDVVVVDRFVNKLELSAGDVIAYRKSGIVIVHRIVEVVAPGVYRTKGDANNAPDPWLVTSGEVLGVVVARIPWIGLPLLLVQPLRAHILAGIAAATVAYYASRRVLRSTRRGARRGALRMS